MAVIDMHKLKVGDKFFAPIPKYRPYIPKSSNIGCRYEEFYGWKIKEATVMKVNKKTVAVSFDSFTRRYPQKINKDGPQDGFCICDNEREIWKILFDKHCDLKSKREGDISARKQCERMLKKFNKLV